MLNISIASTCSPCDEFAPDADGEAFGALVEQWYVAGTEAEVKRDKPFGTRVLGLGIVLFRAADGEIVALVDQCVHRGTRLSAGKSSTAASSVRITAGITTSTAASPEFPASTAQAPNRPVRPTHIVSAGCRC